MSDDISGVLFKRVEHDFALNSNSSSVYLQYILSSFKQVFWKHPDVHTLY